MEFVCDCRKSLQRSELFLHQEGGEVSAYYEKMLLHNRIPGILRYGTIKEEGKQYCKYDIGAKQSLSERYEQSKLVYGQLKWLVEEILRVIEEAGEYLIDEKDIVLRPDCIFLGKDCEELYLCCYPAYQRELGKQFAELFEALMERLDYKDPSAVLLLYKLYIRCREGGCSAAELRSLLETKQEESEKTTCRYDTEFSEHEALTESLQEPVAFLRIEPGYYLQAEGEGESIHLDQFPFLLGKEGERPEARICLRGEELYIEDTNSVYGTFVNGRRLAGNEMQKLNHGDSVMLADKGYRFVRQY